jgi:hypothetical protein
MKLAIAVVAAAILLPLAASGAPAEGSDPAALRLMAECKAASGGAALDRPAAFHEQGAFTRDGAKGAYDEYGDLHQLRTTGVHHFADHTESGGFDGKVGWHEGPDGAVRRITDPAVIAGMRSDAYVTIGGYFFPDRFPAVFRSRGRQVADGRAYDVVDVTPADGDSINLWLDAKTHRVARLTTDADRGYADVFDDRRVDGTWIGFASNQIEPDHRTELRLSAYRYTPLDPTVFSPPGAP